MGMLTTSDLPLYRLQPKHAIERELHIEKGEQSPAYAEASVIDQIEMLTNYRCYIYSTHKHTPEKSRLRLIIPLSREVSPDEYIAVARKVAEKIGIEQFDDTTYEPSRLMYWPSTSSDGEFAFREIDGEILNPDDVLARYANWRNVAEWPVSQRQRTVVQHEARRQADPLTKPGTIGAFCRAYTISEAIDTFLSDVYRPSAMHGRYDYIPADSQAGVVVYEDKFCYSHHATDPVCGQLLNAFDVVRLHRFGHLDARTSEDIDPSKRPSFKAMQEFAVQDARVKETLAEERMAQAQQEFADECWRQQLELDRTGTLPPRHLAMQRQVQESPEVHHAPPDGKRNPTGFSRRHEQAAG